MATQVITLLDAWRIGDSWDVPEGSRPEIDDALVVEDDTCLRLFTIWENRFQVNLDPQNATAVNRDFTARMESQGRIDLIRGDVRASVYLGNHRDDREPYVFTDVVFSPEVVAHFQGEGAPITLTFSDDPSAVLDAGLAGSIAGTADLLNPLDASATLDAGLAGSIAGTADLLSPLDASATLSAGLAGSIAGAATLGAAIAPPAPPPTESGYEIHRRASAPRDVLLTAIELNHPLLPTPARAIRDTASHTIEGNEYAPVYFEVKWADQVEGESPRVEVVVDNVGEALTQWVDISRGGRGATMRLMHVLNDVVQWDQTVDVIRARTADVVRIELGWDILLDGPAVTWRYDMDTAPGLF